MQLPTMLHIECTGSPYEIGFQHGTAARDAIARTIAFYTELFQQNAHRSWPEVLTLASEFLPSIRANWPSYLDEMTGIATGSSQPLLAILALNVRTEIAFGLALHPLDGCTSLAWHRPPSSSSSPASFLAQNWDWQLAQLPNLVHLTLNLSPPLPRIQMITEAGLIGKIGLNSAGVGVCLNAIKARGVDATKLPCHLALRKVLESGSRVAAEEALAKDGVASACHILIADGETGGEGWEWSCREGKRVRTPIEGRVVHANRWLERHGEDTPEDTAWLPDSGDRVRRMEEMCVGLERGEVGVKEVQGLFRDEEGLPGAICRAAGKDDSVQTLFNIVMDLAVPRAEVVVGRPVAPMETLEMEF